MSERRVSAWAWVTLILGAVACGVTVSGELLAGLGLSAVTLGVGVGAWIRITIADDEVRGRGRATLGMIIGGWAFVLASFFAYALMNANWH